MYLRRSYIRKKKRLWLAEVPQTFEVSDKGTRLWLAEVPQTFEVSDKGTRLWLAEFLQVSATHI